MAPKPKFVAPVRKSTTSSGPSSSCSSCVSFTQDANSNVETPSNESQQVQQQAEFAEPPLRSAVATKETVVPLQKRKEVVPNAPAPQPKKRKVEKHDNDISANKENNEGQKLIGKKKKKKTDGPAIPMVSLSDADYDKIFQAVLASDLNSEPLNINQSLNPDSQTEAKLADGSLDLFEEFSQSDLDDSEDEQCKLADAAKKLSNGSQSKSNDSPANGPLSCPSQKPATDLSTQGDVTLIDVTEQEMDSSLLDNSKRSTFKISSSQVEVASSPCITYLCHSSQPHFESSNKERQLDEPQVDRGQKEEQSSLGISSHSFVTSTPRALKCSQNYTNSSQCVTPQRESRNGHSSFSQDFQATPVKSVPNASQISNNSSPFVTPQRANQVRKPQELQASPAGSATNASQGPKTPVTLIQKSSSSMNESTSSQGCRTPVDLNRKQQSFNNESQSTQECRTPVGSQSKNTMNHSSQSPAPSISSSQQFSQELQFTPPPAKKTARERLLWLQKKRLAGLWVQCDQEECGKWRYLPDSHDPTILQDNWYCRMHPDEQQNQCDAQEKRLSLHAEDDMIFNKYSPGSLVWARIPGYPWWPAMVEDDPDLEQFFWLDLFSDIPTWYHVVFFDDKEPVSRAWVQVERLKHFRGKQLNFLGEEAVAYKRRLNAAFTKARQAMCLSIEERLAQYSFASCYKGAIGGSAKKLYDGPIGFRKHVQ